MDDTVLYEPKRNTEKDKIQFARCLVLANNNSPISLRIKNVTTLGRHCSEFLKWSKYKDFDFY